ncbi:MAG: glycoside hydrolase family 20 zincin-like fold domain-containing protein [Vulcanimicrobiaceae bacterium]
MIRRAVPLAGLALCLLGMSRMPAPSRLHLGVLPRPLHVRAAACRARFPFHHPLSVAATFDPAAIREIDARWHALGLPMLRIARRPSVRVVHDGALPRQAYRLDVAGARVTIAASSASGAFYGAMTLAQLPHRAGSGYVLPCVAIADAPALRWRILSDDVSRGPLPTMRYFKERIRTIAAFKMNGYSPYMENTFVSPTDPLPAPLDGITPAQLHELALYAKRYHVAFIPEQQTFAHMHNTLKLERYAAAAERPHGFLLSPASPLSAPYVTRLIRQELAQVPHPPFFHIGSDETQTLGLGQSKALVARLGLARVYADHINAMNKVIAPSGARIMLWDDGIEKNPAIMTMIPKSAVIINWHYGNEKTFMPYIRLIAGGGFQQMVAPGANNWLEIFPDINQAIPAERRFIDEGKRAHVLGLFQTVWHDDGETLYEATWYPVLYAASDAWQQGDLPPVRFAADFPHAFFGVNDPIYATDVQRLGDALTLMESGGKYDWTDYLFWANEMDPQIDARMAKVNLHQVRLDAETVEQNLSFAKPPLHRHAAKVMFLAARRFDILGRKFQIAQEVRAMYADALAHVGQKKNSPVFRDLLYCKYWFWELRDDYEGLIPLYNAAWRFESRPGHLGSNLEQYHLYAQHAVEEADAMNRAIYEDYYYRGELPPLRAVLSKAAPYP